MEQPVMSKSWFCLLSGFSGIVGVVLLGVSFAINNGPPPNAHSVELIKLQAIAEGRDAVQGLRSTTVVANELAKALNCVAKELAAAQASQDGPVFQVTVEGTPRQLHPILREEVYRIAVEAIRNAFRHAQASRIEAEICYGHCQFQLRIRDDGKGMATRVVEEQGRVGHWDGRSESGHSWSGGAARKAELKCSC